MNPHFPNNRHTRTTCNDDSTQYVCDPDHHYYFVVAADRYHLIREYNWLHIFSQQCHWHRRKKVKETEEADWWMPAYYSNCLSLQVSLVVRGGKKIREKKKTRNKMRFLLLILLEWAISDMREMSIILSFFPSPFKIMLPSLFFAEKKHPSFFTYCFQQLYILSFSSATIFSFCWSAKKNEMEKCIW